MTLICYITGLRNHLLTIYTAVSMRSRSRKSVGNDKDSELCVQRHPGAVHRGLYSLTVGRGRAARGHGREGGVVTRTQRQGIRPSAGLPESGERAGALRQERERAVGCLVYNSHM